MQTDTAQRGYYLSVIFLSINLFRLAWRRRVTAGGAQHIIRYWPCTRRNTIKAQSTSIYNLSEVSTTKPSVIEANTTHSSVTGDKLTDESATPRDCPKTISVLLLPRLLTSTGYATWQTSSNINESASSSAEGNLGCEKRHTKHRTAKSSHRTKVNDSSSYTTQLGPYSYESPRAAGNTSRCTKNLLGLALATNPPTHTHFQIHTRYHTTIRPQILTHLH